MRIYPNPASGYMMVTGLEGLYGNLKIRAMDVFGRINELVFTRQGNILKVPVGTLHSGLWLLLLEDDHGASALRLLVEHGNDTEFHP